MEDLADSETPPTIVTKLLKLKVMQTERGGDAPMWAVPGPLSDVLSCFTVQA